MDILRDLIRFLGVILFGMRDTTKVFAENLEMAERYVRWGGERKDMRDYYSAIKHCDACHDEDAPKPDQVLRKYTALFDSLLGVLELNIERYREANDTAQSKRSQKHEEIDAVRKKLETERALIRKMQQDGNMLKAQAEARHVEETERQLNRMQEDASASDPVAQLRDQYRVATEEHVRFRKRLEMAFVVLREQEELSREAVNQLIESAQVSAENIEGALRSMAPESTDAAAGAGSP